MGDIAPDKRGYPEKYFSMCCGYSLEVLSGASNEYQSMFLLGIRRKISVFLFEKTKQKKKQKKQTKKPPHLEL